MLPLSGECLQAQHQVVQRRAHGARVAPLAVIHHKPLWVYVYKLYSLYSTHDRAVGAVGLLLPVHSAGMGKTTRRLEGANLLDMKVLYTTCISVEGIQP